MEELVPNIPRIYTAVAEWATCMLCIVGLKKRGNGWQSVLLCACFLGMLIGLQILAGLLPLAFWIPGMLAAVLTMCLGIFAIARVRFMDAVFWAAKAFVLAEFAASLGWQFHYYFGQQFPGLREAKWFEIVFMALTFAVVFGLILLLERRYKKSNRQLAITLKDHISAVGIAVVIFIISNISFLSANTPLSGSEAGEIFYIRTLVDLCGVILLYAQQEQRLSLHARIELNATQNILNRQYENYRLFKENIDLLNRQYHDLKHKIGVIRGTTDDEKREEYIQDMEKSILRYDAYVETGNKILDTILIQKSNICVDNGITFTCIADGKQLEFMQAMDICSIFGNALDNAIESVMKVADKDKRVIKMSIYLQNKFLFIRVENYFDKALQFENGLPVTTKVRKHLHGYGLKSIRYSVEKYGGQMEVSVQDCWFSLCLLLPMNQEI